MFWASAFFQSKWNISFLLHFHSVNSWDITWSCANHPSVAIKFKLQGVTLIFFSDSHLAPKSYKVVANSKKVGRHFPRQTKLFFYTVIILEIKLGKRSLTCYKVDTRMDDIQPSSSPKSKMVSSYQSRCMCCVSETNLTRKFAADLSLQIFLIHYISR